MIVLTSCLAIGSTLVAEAQVRLQSAALPGAGGFTASADTRVGVTLGQTFGGLSNDDFNAGGVGFWYTTLDAITVVSSTIERLGEEIPQQYELNQNYPNPFNPTTRIKYGLPESGHVRLTVYNVLGQLVSLIVSKEQTAGYYEVTWDARTDSGVQVPSGLYFLRIEAGDFSSTRSMVFQK
jgi:hypothetical protein